MRSIQRTLMVLSLLSFALFTANILTGCAPDQNFGALPGASLGRDLSGAGGPYVCADDLGGGTGGGITNGLKGKIYYEKAGLTPHILQVKDFSSPANLSSGNSLLIAGNIYLSQMFIPDRLFTAGFSYSNNAPVTREDGSILEEYFSIQAESTLILANKPAGNYQIAVFSDDGAILDYTVNGSPYSINNDGNHRTRMMCANSTVAMNSTTAIPLKYYYYQGPREHISTILLWKKVTSARPLEPNGLNYTFTHSDGTSKTVMDCAPPTAHPQNHYFNNYDGVNPVLSYAKTPYLDMLDRGWEPIPSENLILPNGGTNPCAN